MASQGERHADLDHHDGDDVVYVAGDTHYVIIDLFAVMMIMKAIVQRWLR